MIWQSLQVKKLISLAIEEDLSQGDITSVLCVPEQAEVSAKLIAKEDFVVCGLGVIAAVFEKYNAQAQIELQKCDGDFVEKHSILAVVEGQARDILALERIILNFLQRLSGVASYCHELVKEANNLVVLDTRKTTPGWRVLEKYATAIGGARNHRFHLGDMILIKDNHIDVGGGDLQKTLQTVYEKKPYYMPVEVEVRTLVELEEVLKGPCDVVMLDNMDDGQIAKALELVEVSARKPMVEVSGNIAPERFAQLEALGVRCVSMGALTSKARNVDISLSMCT